MAKKQQFAINKIVPIAKIREIDSKRKERGVDWREQNPNSKDYISNKPNLYLEIDEKLKEVSGGGTPPPSGTDTYLDSVSVNQTTKKMIFTMSDSTTKEVDITTLLTDKYIKTIWLATDSKKILFTFTDNTQIHLNVSELFNDTYLDSVALNTTTKKMIFTMSDSTIKELNISDLLDSNDDKYLDSVALNSTTKKMIFTFNDSSTKEVEISDLFNVPLVASTNSAIPQFDGTNGKIKDSKVLILSDESLKTKDITIDGGVYITDNSGCITSYNCGSYVKDSHITGALVIDFGTFNSNMLVADISIYDYETGKSGVLHIAGHNSSSYNKWVECSANSSGSLPFDNVKFAHKTGGDNSIVILGGVSSTLKYPHIYITRVTSGFHAKNVIYSDLYVGVETDLSSYEIDSTIGISISSGSGDDNSVKSGSININNKELNLVKQDDTIIDIDLTKLPFNANTSTNNRVPRYSSNGNLIDGNITDNSNGLSYKGDYILVRSGTISTDSVCRFDVDKKIVKSDLSVGNSSGVKYKGKYIVTSTRLQANHTDANHYGSLQIYNSGSNRGLWIGGGNGDSYAEFKCDKVSQFNFQGAKFGFEKANPTYLIDVNGDINVMAGKHYRIAGVEVLGASLEILQLNIVTLLENSWNGVTNNDLKPTILKLANGMVQIVGLVVGGANNTRICNLPLAYRPLKDMVTSQTLQDGGTQRVDLTTNGNIFCSDLGDRQYNNTNMSLNFVYFAGIN